MPSSVPPVKGGQIIGRPYQGTHGRAFNQRGGSDNWESENAVDIAVPVGTPVYATEDGTIGQQFGSLGRGGRFAGMRLHLVAKNGEFYYAHLSAFAAGIRPGTHVTAGQLLGYSGEANGVAHLHFASTTNLAPLRFVKGLPAQSEGPVALPGINVDDSGATQLNQDGTVKKVPDTTTAQLSSAIGQIPQVGGAPLATPPLVGDQQSFAVTPRQSGSDTWQLIAAQGNVSQDTIRLAQLASYGVNGASSG